MEFKISYKKLLKALQKVQGIIERREIKPILSNILIKAGENQIEISATNLEVSIKEFLEAEIFEKGSMVLDAKKVFEIIKEMPDKEIYFKKKENNWIEITTDNIFFNIVGVDAKEFPEVSFLEEEEFQEVNKRNIKEMIEKTIFAASNDETRVNLNGVFFEKIIKAGKDVIRMVATDGHRLSMIDKEIEGDSKKGILAIEPLQKGLLFPKKGLLELKKMLDDGLDNQNLFLLLKQNNGIFKKENMMLSIRVIDEEFPNYKQAIPEEIKNKAIIDRIRFLNSLKRISVIAEERSKAINLFFGKNTLEVFTINPVFGEGRETISIGYEGENIRLGFNAGYLVDSINAIDGEEIVIKIKDKDSPVTITPLNDDEYTCVIMPMEIKE
ncbi:MAG: DNA polymerase III subunit beta [Thermodesulfobacteriota bacterium]|jgi:DNA polymerase-3 subunit beta|nr:MAG: DNA polymerase III subunit beta [Thermodesulfobacteriota bacterium]